MTIWIVGRGIVGRRLARLFDAGQTRFHDPRTEMLQIAAGEVAVLCHPERHAPLAEEIAERGASVVTVGDDFDDAQDLVPLGRMFESHGTTLVVGAALSPGLSGLLARHLASGTFDHFASGKILEIAFSLVALDREGEAEGALDALLARKKPQGVGPDPGVVFGLALRTLLLRRRGETAAAAFDVETLRGLSAGGFHDVPEWEADALAEFFAEVDGRPTERALTKLARRAGEACLIDPGMDAREMQAIADIVQAQGARPAVILLTHWHWDHVLGPEYIPGVRVAERPIAYHPRTRAQGKKIRWRDGWMALWCAVKYRRR